MPHPSSANINNRSPSRDNSAYERAECSDCAVDDEQQADDEEEIVPENERVPGGTRVVLNDRQVGQVTGNDVSFHYAVDFGDGCYSHDMLAEDILDFDPAIEPLTLVVGGNIRIKWTDGTVYSCKYLGRKRVLLYHVKLDSETRQIRRSEFSYDVQPPSPPLTPCQTDREHNYSRRQPVTAGTKRQAQRRKPPGKRKRRRVLLSSSSSSSLDES